MNKMIRARFCEGVIVPLEDLDLADGEEIAVIVTDPVEKTEGKSTEYLRESCGAWKGLIDAEALKKNIYADRLINTRPRPEL
jgi:predicted DNA-binding antitoxin AbrB/MazE fold protein